MFYHDKKDRILLIAAAICLVIGIALLTAGCCTHVDFRLGFGTMILKNTGSLNPGEFRAKIQEIIQLGDLEAAEVRYIWSSKDKDHRVQILPAGIQDDTWDQKVKQGWEIKEAWIILSN